MKLMVIACCILTAQPAFCQTTKKTPAKKAKVKPYSPQLITNDIVKEEEKLIPPSSNLDIDDLNWKCFERSFEPTDTIIYKVEIITAETIEFRIGYNNTRLTIRTQHIVKPIIRRDFEKTKDKYADTEKEKYIEGKSTIEGNKLYFVPEKSEFKKQIFHIIYKEKKDGIVKLINTENNKVYVIGDCPGLTPDIIKQ